MTKHLWIVNHHAALPSKDGRGGRHVSLASQLPNSGWTASIIAASTTHPSGEQRLKGARFRLLKKEGDVTTLWIRTVSYGSSYPLRLLGMVIFALMVLTPGMTRGLDKPTAVIGSTVHPFAAWAGRRLAARHKVPFVYEIRDVWPDALIDLGRLNRSSILSKLLSRLSRNLCKASSLVISPLPGIRKYLDANGFPETPFAWISNGVEPTPVPLCPPRQRPFTFMYLGSHGHANALDEIIDAFALACELAPGKAMQLRLVGDGPLKARLIEYASSLPQRDSIAFDDRIRRDEVIARAQDADCLVARLHDHPVYQYGISPNKIFDYQLASKPVVFASTAPNNPIKEADSGIVVESDDLTAFASALVTMAHTSSADLARMGERGRSYVLESFTYPKLACKLVHFLDQLVIDSH